MACWRVEMYILQPVRTVNVKCRGNASSSNAATGLLVGQDCLERVIHRVEPGCCMFFGNQSFTRKRAF